MPSCSVDLGTKGFSVVSGPIPLQTCMDLLAFLPKSSGAGSRTLLDRGEICEIAANIRNSTALSDILSSKVAVQCTSFEKTQDSNWGVRLHRDRVVPIKGDGEWESVGTKEGLTCVRPPLEVMAGLVAVRLSLDGAPEGDLQVVPRSHVDYTVSYERSQAIPVSVPAGGALVMNPLLAHASTKLRSAQSRSILHFLYAHPKLPVGYEWYYAV